MPKKNTLSPDNIQLMKDLNKLKKIEQIINQERNKNQILVNEMQQFAFQLQQKEEEAEEEKEEYLQQFQIVFDDIDDAKRQEIRDRIKQDKEETQNKLEIYNVGMTFFSLVNNAAPDSNATQIKQNIERKIKILNSLQEKLENPENQNN